MGAPEEPHHTDSDDDPYKFVGVRMEPVYAYLLAAVTVVSVYTELAVIVYFAAEDGTPWWMYTALAFWGGSSVLVMLWSAAQAQSQCILLPSCCRTLLGGGSGDVSRDEDVWDYLLTLLQLRIIREARHYHNKWLEAQERCNPATSVEWRHRTQQPQMRFLHSHRTQVMFMHTPQVVLVAYIILALDSYGWFAVASEGLSLAVMAFSFCTAHEEPFGLAWKTFVKDMVFHGTYLLGMLVCYSLFAACLKQWVFLAAALSAATNAVLLHCGSERVFLPCLHKGSNDTWGTLFRLLLECAGRLVFIDIGRMAVSLWEPRRFWRPIFVEECQGTNWFIFWTNWLFALLLLLPVFIRRDSDVPDGVCGQFEERITNNSTAPWSNKLGGSLGLAGLNMGLLVGILMTDVHDRRIEAPPSVMAQATAAAGPAGASASAAPATGGAAGVGSGASLEQSGSQVHSTIKQAVEEEIWMACPAAYRDDPHSWISRQINREPPKVCLPYGSDTLRAQCVPGMSVQVLSADGQAWLAATVHGAGEGEADVKVRLDHACEAEAVSLQEYRAVRFAHRHGRARRQSPGTPDAPPGTPATDADGCMEPASPSRHDTSRE